MTKYLEIIVNTSRHQKKDFKFVQAVILVFSQFHLSSTLLYC